MTNTALDTFRELVNGLTVDVSVDANGVYTVCSRSEPFFCYEGDSREAVVDMSVRTLSSYARTFLGLTDINLAIHEREKDQLPFAIERSEKIESVYLEAA